MGDTFVFSITRFRYFPTILYLICEGEYYWILPGIFHLQKILEDPQKILSLNKIVPLYTVSTIVCHMSNLKKEKRKKRETCHIPWLVDYRTIHTLIGTKIFTWQVDTKVKLSFGFPIWIFRILKYTLLKLIIGVYN